MKKKATSTIATKAKQKRTGKYGGRKTPGAVEPQKLVDLRIKNGHTQSEAADFIGVSLRCLSQWESGTNKIHPVWYNAYMMKSFLASDSKLKEKYEKYAKN